MPTRDITLTDHQDTMIESLVQSGRYRNVSEVVGDALHLIEEREAAEMAKLKALREAAQIGIDAIERGEFKHFADMDEAIAYLTCATDDLLEANEHDPA